MLEGADFLESAFVEQGLVTAAEIETARSLCAEEGCCLDEGLAAIGAADARSIARVKAQLFEVPYLDLTHFEINHANSRLIPAEDARRHLMFPLFALDGVVTLAAINPLDLGMTERARQLLKAEVDVVQVEPGPLRTLIDRAYSFTDSAPRAEPEGKLRNTEIDDSGPIDRAVTAILHDAAALNATDIHLNPECSELHLRYRIDGALVQRQGPPLSLHSRLVQRIKVLSRLDLTETRRPQDGKFRFEHMGREFDVRVSIVPTVTGENVVLRLLNSHGVISTLEDLGISAQPARRLREILTEPYGMLLITGPTGSGKTTTVYTALSMLNTPDRNVITIEDPVEIRVPGLRQMQVNPAIDLTFSTLLRSILRQDPDVILVGEIRDSETAAIAVQASMTGHFVLTTLHTNDAIGAFVRLTELDVEPFAVSAAVLGSTAQRLVRCVCTGCRTPDTPDPILLDRFELESSEGLWRGRGCSECLQTGFRGRTSVSEVIRLTPNLRAAVARNADVEVLRRWCIEDQTQWMWQDGLQKALQGVTSLAEVARVASVERTDAPSVPMRRSA